MSFIKFIKPTPLTSLLRKDLSGSLNLFRKLILIPSYKICSLPKPLFLSNCKVSKYKFIKLNNGFFSLNAKLNETEQKEGRLAIRFTCKVCQHINMKTMSKQAYQEGVVLIQCDGCKNRHLIADNLGWFRDNKVNIEEIAKEQVEMVRHFDASDPSLSGLFEHIPSENQPPQSILEEPKKK